MCFCEYLYILTIRLVKISAYSKSIGVGVLL